MDIYIYNTQLRRDRDLTFGNFGYICGIAQVDDHEVAIATMRGLVVIDRQGKQSGVAVFYVNQRNIFNNNKINE